jgi:hypothetical protein
LFGNKDKAVGDFNRAAELGNDDAHAYLQNTLPRKKTEVEAE